MGSGLDVAADAARWGVTVGDGGAPAGAGRGVRVVAAPAGWRDQRLRPVARSRGRAPGGGSAGVGPGPRDGILEHKPVDSVRGGRLPVRGSRRAGGWDVVCLSLDSCHRRRVADARARPFRELHRRLTDLWVALAGEGGCGIRPRRGRVVVGADLLRAGRPFPDAPPPGSWPEWLSWATYFDSHRYGLLPPLSAELGGGVRPTPDGAAVITLLPDPAAVDVVRFARLHHEYRRAVGLSSDQAPGI